jgi:hypothetical protein
MNQQTAQGLAALGRGPDSMLVHMAPQEVAGLQALALKHGGSLTINPETGLPEAGFLSSILPMVLGAGLAATGIGAPMAAMLVGGGYGVAKGSLKEGLMAGLGAYGGAGLGAGLMGAGAGAAGTAGTAAAASELAGTQAALQQNALTNLGIPSNAAAGTGAMSFTPSATTNLLGNAANVAGPMSVPVTTSQLVGGIPQVVTATALPVPAMAPTFSEGLSQMGSGVKDVLSSGDKALAFAKNNAGTLGAVGLSALAGMQPDNLKTPTQNQGMIRPYTYSREKVPSAFQDVAGAPMSSKERRYFTDQYTALTPYKAPGPEYMAEGGPVEAMSDANAIGMNTGYPQADIRTGAYATPYQQPISRNVVTGVQDAGVNPYTGQAQFADGGSVGGYTYDPKTGLYTKPGGQGATVVSPTGGISGASGSSGGDLAPLSQKTNDYLTWEETTPEGRMARDARMEQVQGLFSLGPLGAITQALTGRESVPFDLNSLLGTPQAYTDYQSNFARGMDPMSGPGTIGSRDTRGSNESSPGGGYDASDYGGYSGSETQSSGEAYANAKGGLMALAQGGISHLGDYSDGGRLLRGPGDGVSDDIPAMIGQKQQARLADGEFVVPARIVSELGNGSTEAGARQLYAMMDRVQKARRKTVGKDKVATNSRAAKLLPA